MRRMAWVRLVVLSGLAVVPVGCGPDPFGAPARAKVKPALPIDPSETARSVYLIIPGPLDIYLEHWGMAGQREAGVDNSIFRAVGPPSGSPAIKSSKLIKDAIDDGANSIVVVPDEDPDLPKALAEAESRKIPVALLGRSIPQASGETLPEVVTMVPLGPIADRLLATALDDCKRIGLSTEGTALIVDHKGGDPYREERVEALRQALARKGIKKVEVLSIDGKATDASTKVMEAVKKFPDIFLALCDDDEAMQASVVARVQSNGKPHFFVTGFVGNWVTTSTEIYKAESAYVEPHYENLARVAVRSVLNKAKGKPGPIRKPVEPIFYRGEALTTKDEGGLKPPPPKPLGKEGPLGRDQ